jgi:hypothetical protein
MIHIDFNDLLSLRFVHAYTDVFDTADDASTSALGTGPAQGSTTWFAELPENDAKRVSTAGLCACLQWEWLEIAAGVVAIFSPLDLRSNIRLLGPGERPMNKINTLARFNRVIHRLDWQAEVRQAILEKIRPSIPGSPSDGLDLEI